MRYETLKTIAIPYLLAIQDRMTETFGLSVLDERRIKNLILYSLRGPDYSCFSFAEKTATPLHTSAPGKALVANLPEKCRAALLDRMTFDWPSTTRSISRPSSSERPDSRPSPTANRRNGTTRALQDRPDRIDRPPS